MHSKKFEIGIRCPKCILIFVTDKSKIGKEVECPYCGTGSVATEDGYLEIGEATPVSCGS